MGGAKAKVVYMKEKYYGEYHHSLCLCNLSKCQQLILSKQSIYLQAVYIFHGATSILDGLVCVHKFYVNIRINKTRDEKTQNIFPQLRFKSVMQVISCSVLYMGSGC